MHVVVMAVVVVGVFVAAAAVAAIARATGLAETVRLARCVLLSRVSESRRLRLFLARVGERETGVSL